MKSTFAVRTKVNIDDTTALMDISWDCPYCELPNFTWSTSRFIKSMDQNFEIDIRCEHCNKKVTVICTDLEELFP